MHSLIEAWLDRVQLFLTSSNFPLPILPNVDRLNNISPKSKRSHTMEVEDGSSSCEEGQVGEETERLCNVGNTQNFW